MADSAAFKPAPASSDHLAAAPQSDHLAAAPQAAEQPLPGAPASRPRPASGLLRPSQVPLPGETTRRAGSPSPAGGRAHHGLQRLRPSGAPAGAALPLARPSAVPARPVQDTLRGPGQPLAAPLREEMQARLGADLSDVRVHTGGAARASATEVGARAYTSGSHVVIGDGGADKHTLAHELTHVIQQRQGPVAGTDQRSGFKVSDPFDAYEKAAEVNAARVMRAPLSQHRLAAAGTVGQGTPLVHPGGESEQTHQPALNHAEVMSDTGRHRQSGLVHVVQQRPTDRFEREAEATAARALSGVRPAGAASGGVLPHTSQAGRPTGNTIGHDRPHVVQRMMTGDIEPPGTSQPEGAEPWSHPESEFRMGTAVHLQQILVQRIRDEFGLEARVSLGGGAGVAAVQMQRGVHDLDLRVELVQTEGQGPSEIRKVRDDLARILDLDDSKTVGTTTVRGTYASLEVSVTFGPVPTEERELAVVGTGDWASEIGMIPILLETRIRLLMGKGGGVRRPKR